MFWDVITLDMTLVTHKAMTPRLSVIVPTFNEADNIAILIPRLMAVLDPLGPYEIIVVDDNSPDLTWQVVETFAEAYPQVRLVRRMDAKGLSSAILAGFQSSRGHALGVIDADLQHDVSILPQLIAGLDESPIVIASRYLEASSTGHWSGIRVTISRCAIWLAQRTLRLQVSDPLSGYFVMRREVFYQVEEQLNPMGFKILMEILYRSKIENIQEAPYVFGVREHGTSKLNVNVGWDYLVSIYDLLFSEITTLRFVQFCLVGLSGVVVNMVILLFLLQYTELSADVSLAAAIGVAMISNFLLNNVWTFHMNRLQDVSQVFRGILRFLIVCALGAFINYSIAVVLKERLDIDLNLANLFGIAIAAVWNYQLSTGAIWRRE